MMLRHLERQPLRTTVSVVGVAVAVAVLVVRNFSVDSLDYVIETQFEVAQLQDVSVAFVEDTTADATCDLVHLPGVRFAEPFRALPIRASSGPRSRRLALLGLPAEQRLFRVFDVVGKKTEIAPGPGLVVSSKLAEVLGVNLGDSITVEVLEEDRPVDSVPIVATVDDFSGISAYTSLATTWRIMHDETISGSYLAVDAAQLDSLYSELKTSPRVASVTVKRAALDSFRQTVAENLLRMRLFNVLFACAIAFGVVYNAARIALSERGRELATLRVIGFRRSEVSLILLGELAIITAIAIPLGLVLGYGLAALVIELGFDTELFRIPLVIERRTYGFAALVTAIAAIVSGLIVRRRLDRLDLVAVLKSRE
jgi:putative ABC transport system permease protein